MQASNMENWLKDVFLKPDASVHKEVDLLLWSFRLERIRRYLGQPYWDAESLDAKCADKVEPFPRLETVAEHSWHVADAVLMLGWRFPYLNISHAVKLAIVHDKMEISIGDWNPLGRDGTGERGHAFNKVRARSKDEAERDAIEAYIAKLEPSSRASNRALLLEALECRSPEARYVKCLDKMAALAFILLKKDGRLDSKHVRFLIRFTFSNNRYFPPLDKHSNELLRRNLTKYGNRAKVSRSQIVALARHGDQLELELEFADLEPLAIDEQLHSGRCTTKSARLARVFQAMDSVPPARTGVEAQTQLANNLNRIEDEYWPGVWAPPRFYPPGASTDRLYPIGSDSIYPVNGWRVDVLVSGRELIYISAGGAIEVRLKSPEGQRIVRDQPKNGDILYSKLDSEGRSVWDSVWRTADPTLSGADC